jgi:hypothetical protein
MKFNKATKKLLSEMDMSSVSGMRMNDRIIGSGNPEDMKIRIMRKMGADDKVISRWRAAEAKGITFESFLLGLVDELKNKQTTDYSDSAYDDDDELSFE